MTTSRQIFRQFALIIASLALMHRPTTMPLLTTATRRLAGLQTQTCKKVSHDVSTRLLLDQEHLLPVSLK